MLQPLLQRTVGRPDDVPYALAVAEEVDPGVARKARRAIAARYTAALADMDEIVTPAEAEPGTHVYHQYTIRVLNGRRDEVKEALAQSGVGSMIYYPVPLHRLPVYDDLDIHLPHSEQAAQEVLSLPMWPYLSEDKQARVIDALRAAVRAAVP